MPTHMKTAAELLIEYGYTEVTPAAGGARLFIPARPSSERWAQVDGGWLCYVPPSATFGGGEPWGRSVDGGLIQVPFTQAEAFANAGGLHPAKQPEAFVWVWPEERLVNIYSHASKAGPNDWRRTEDGEYVEADKAS